MGYWYVPSTYRGSKYGRGIKGYGRFVGGSFSGGVAFMDSSPVETPVEEAIEETADPVDQAKIAEAEATGKPVTVKKSTFNLWNGMKGLASGTWNLAKKAYANPLINAGLKMGATYLAEQYGPGLAMGALRGAYKGYLKGRDALNSGLDGLAYNRMKNKAPEFVGNILNDESIPMSERTNAAKTMINEAIKYGSNTLGEKLKRGWNKANQWGTQALSKGFNAYRSWRGIRGSGRGRFRKGSPEAKAYMAMLRARRRTRRGMGILGGWYKGVNPMRLYEALNDPRQQANAQIYVNNVDLTGRVQDKNNNDLLIERGVAQRMLDGYNNMNAFWMNNNYDANGNIIAADNDADAAQAFKMRYIRENRLRGKRYPLKHLSRKRMQLILNQLERKKDIYYTKKFWNKRYAPNKLEKVFKLPPRAPGEHFRYYGSSDLHLDQRRLMKSILSGVKNPGTLKARALNRLEKSTDVAYDLMNTLQDANIKDEIENIIDSEEDLINKITSTDAGDIEKLLHLSKKIRRYNMKLQKYKRDLAAGIIH